MMASNDMGLRNMLISYKFNNEAMNDISSAGRNFKDLRHLKKSFTYGNGQTKVLVCLEGTIPISYKTRTYNIPIIIWFHETHPYDAPMVFVQPTATMNIKPGNHVAQNGAVAVPYINDWRKGSSDTITLISVLCLVFGESPPVFAKGRGQPQSQNQPFTSTAGANPPYPASGGNMPLPYPPSGQTSYAPAPPAYPPQANTGYPPAASNAAPSGYNPYVQQTPYPPTTAASIGGYPQSYGQGTGYTGTGMPTPGYPGYPSQTTSGYPPTTATIAYPSHPGYPTTTYTNPAAVSTETSTATSGSDRESSMGLSNSDQEKLARMSLVEMMKQKLKDIMETHENEMGALRITQKELTEGKDKLEKLNNTTQTETVECENAISILSAKISELKEAIEKNSSEEELPVEDAIDATAPIYRQLLRTYAEEQAIDDTLYILGDALRQETMGLELYLKKVRDLSRKQFMLRALIQKCREKAGLSDVYS